MKKLISSLFLLLVVLQNISAQDKKQERIYMPFFEMINMPPEYQYSSSRLLKTYIDDLDKYLLLLPEKPAQGLYPTEALETSAAKATAMNANYYMQGSMNRIGEKIIITVTMYNVRGKKVWSDRLTAKDIEDIDPVLQRIARNVGTDVKAFDDVDIYTVTTPEKEQLEKAEANNAFGISVGGAFPLDNIDGAATGAGLIWSFDVRNMIFEIDLQSYFGPKSNLYVGSLECYYPFNAKRVTPFIGGGLGIGGTTVKSEKDVTVYNTDFFGRTTSRVEKQSDYFTKGGLLMQFGGGYMFNRTSNVSFRVGGYLFKGFYNTGGVSTTGIIIKVDIMFAR